MNGKDYKEFGTVQSMTAPATLTLLEVLVQEVRADYEHHRKHEFPFFNDDPTIVWDIRPGMLIVGWHIAVPVAHLVVKPE